MAARPPLSPRAERRREAEDALAVVERKRLDAEAARARAARAVRRAELAYERAEPRYRGARKRDLLRAEAERKQKLAAVRRNERKLEAREAELRALVKKLARPMAAERRQQKAKEEASRKMIEEAKAREREAKTERTRAIAEERRRLLETAEGRRQEEEKQRFLRARKGEDRVYAELAWQWLKSALSDVVRELRREKYQASSYTKIYRESAIVHGRLSFPYPQKELFTAIDEALREISGSSWFQDLYFAARVTTEGFNKDKSPGETSRTTPDGKVRQRYHSHYFRAISASGFPNGHSYMLSTAEGMVRKIEEVSGNKAVSFDVMIRYVASGKRPERPSRKRRASGG